MLLAHTWVLVGCWWALFYCELRFFGGFLNGKKAQVLAFYRVELICRCIYFALAGRILRDRALIQIFLRKVLVWIDVNIQLCLFLPIISNEIDLLGCYLARLCFESCPFSVSFLVIRDSIQTLYVHRNLLVLLGTFTQICLFLHNWGWHESETRMHRIGSLLDLIRRIFSLFCNFTLFGHFCNRRFNFCHCNYWQLEDFLLNFYNLLGGRQLHHILLLNCLHCTCEVSNLAAASRGRRQILFLTLKLEIVHFCDKWLRFWLKLRRL